MKSLLEKSVQIFKKSVDALEDPNLPLWYVVFTFLASVGLRNFLEFFSNKSWVKGDILLHFYLYYVTLGLTLLVLMRLLTKERIARLFKVIFSCFIVLIVAPITDLLVSRGKGQDITYLMPEFHGDLIGRFFTFFGKFQEFGISPGMKVEIFLVLLATLLFFYVKNFSWQKILLGIVSVYAVIFFYLASPYFIKAFFGWLNLPFDYSETLFINYYLAVIFLLLIILAFLENRNFFWSILRDIRLARLFHYWLMFVLGLILAIKVKGPLILTEEALFYLPFILMGISLAWIFSVMTNNIADIEIDKVCNQERPLVKAEIPLADYKKIMWLVLALTLIYTVAVNIKVLFLVVFFLGNYFIYSMPPLRIKRIPFFSKIVILLNSTALIILGFTGLNNLNALYFLKFIQNFGANFNNFSLLVGLFLFSWLLAINFIDIKDYAGDKKEGIKTLPVIFGLRAGKAMIGAGAFLCCFLIGFFTGDGKILLIATLFGLLQFYLINRKNYQEKYFLALYLIFLLSFFFIIG